MSAPQPKSGIMTLPPYMGGQSALAGVANPVKLSANETPLGPSPKAVAAYRAVADALAAYPDGNAAELRAALAAKHGLAENQIICGAGSDELLQLLAFAYAGAGDEVLATEHGFLVFQLAASAAGATPVPVAEVGLTAHVDNILAAVTGRTKIIFLANPNNPTGTMLGAAEIARLHKGLRDDILLVLDGAYAEYVTAPDYDAGFKLAGACDNVFVTRTFSKIYGLAGLRLGWGYGAEAIVQVLNRLRGPFNVSTPAAAAGLAALSDEAHLEKAMAHNEKWRGWLAGEIAQAGFAVTPSQANFVLVSFADAGGAEQADKALQDDGIIARRLDSYGLPHALRITIGLEDAMRRVAKIFHTLGDGK